jgi:hypothetical protein
LSGPAGLAGLVPIVGAGIPTLGVAAPPLPLAGSAAAGSVPAKSAATPIMIRTTL